MKRQVLLNWQAHTATGWGLLGLNIFQHWASDRDLQPLMGFPITADDIQGTDPLRIAAMTPAAVVSNQFLEQLNAGTLNLRECKALVVDSLGNGLNPPNPRRVGVRSVGRCIFENTLVGEWDRKINGYDGLLCASNWAATLLRANTRKPVAMIHEGIDHSQFFPGPRSGLWDRGRFYVFSGGKVEFRKGHDLALLAFRNFASRRSDAVLVASWHSPFPQFSIGFQGRLRTALRTDAQGGLDIQRWVAENGIPLSQFVELPMMPNSMMPMVLREMDVALQVSRCEACTNLPAMEAMACGVPVILADNTGVRDLIDGDNCVALHTQRPIAAISQIGTEGWGESSVDEIEAALELLYTDTQSRKRIGVRGAEWVLENQRTWRDHAMKLKAYLLSL
jgi:glycosyltransferase involved in cell wall biosynthesis